MKLGIICTVSNEGQRSPNLFPVQDENKSNKLKVDNKSKNDKFLNSQHPSTDLEERKEGRDGRREGGRDERRKERRKELRKERREHIPKWEENACAQR